MSTRIRDRYSFANIEEALPLPDLVAIQRKSFDWFLQDGLRAVLESEHGLERIGGLREKLAKEVAGLA